MFQWVPTLQFSSKMMALYGQWEVIIMVNSEMVVQNNRNQPVQIESSGVVAISDGSLGIVLFKIKMVLLVDGIQRAWKLELAPEQVRV